MPQVDDGSTVDHEETAGDGTVAALREADELFESL
jgi:hypothetical protein